MKNFLLSIIALVLLIPAFAQSPESFTYQAVVRDGSGNVLPNQNVGIQIRILETSASGTAVYTETHSETTNGFGLVNLSVGTGTSSDDFSAIGWGFDDHFIEVSIDPSGGTSYSITGTSQLLSVPYALQAKQAQWINAANGNGIQYFPVAVAERNVAIRDNPSQFSRFLVSTDDPNTGLGNIRAFNYNSDGAATIQVSNDLASNFVMGIGGSTFEFGGNEAYLWNFASSPIKIATSGLERMRIAANGDIGIGTTTPDERVHITGGDIYLEDADSGVIMKSAGGNCFKLTVSDLGAPIFTAINPCP